MKPLCVKNLSVSKLGALWAYLQQEICRQVIKSDDVANK